MTYFIYHFSDVEWGRDVPVLFVWNSTGTGFCQISDEMSGQNQIQIVWCTVFSVY